MPVANNLNMYSSITRPTIYPRQEMDPYEETFILNTFLGFNASGKFFYVFNIIVKMIDEDAPPEIVASLKKFAIKIPDVALEVENVQDKLSVLDLDSLSRLKLGRRKTSIVSSNMNLNNSRAGCLIYLRPSSPMSIIVSERDLVEGTYWDFVLDTDQTVTFTTVGGPEIISAGNKVTLQGRGSMATIIKTSGFDYILGGNLV